MLCKMSQYMVSGLCGHFYFYGRYAQAHRKSLQFPDYLALPAANLNDSPTQDADKHSDTGDVGLSSNSIIISTSPHVDLLGCILHRTVHSQLFESSSLRLSKYTATPVNLE